MNPLRALRRVFPKRKHGVVAFDKERTTHSEVTMGQRMAAERSWKQGDIAFSYVVHPLRKFIEIKRANYASVQKLGELLKEARALSTKLKLPLRGIISGIIRGEKSEPAIVFDVDLRRETFRVNDLNLRDKHALYTDLRTAKNAAKRLGLSHAEFTYQTTEMVGNNTLEHVTELDLPQGWTMTKRAEVGSRGGTRKTYYLHRAAPF